MLGWMNYFFTRPKRLGLNALLMRGVKAFMMRMAKEIPSG
jgi:hypothetical protein